MQQPKIEYRNYGLGDLRNNIIYLNVRLKEHPKLHHLVLKHELKHYNQQEHVDLKEPWNWELALFIAKNPSTWMNFSPIWIIRENNQIKIIYSKFMMLNIGFLFFWILGCIGVWQWIT